MTPEAKGAVSSAVRTAFAGFVPGADALLEHFSEAHENAGARPEALIASTTLAHSTFFRKHSDLIPEDLLTPQGRVTLCAIDGTTTSDLGRQLDRVPVDATHLVLSLGGNDALMNADLLDTPAKSTGHALDI